MRTTDLILMALQAEDPHGMSGAELCKATGTGAARIYPALGVLEADGVIESEWEKPEPTLEPRRRLYWLAGRAALSEASRGQTEEG